MSTEAKLISAVCKNGDINSVISTDVNNMFVSHGDIWGWVKHYTTKYGRVPDVETVTEKWGDFEPQEVKGDTKFYADQLREEFINSQIKSALYDAGSKLHKVPASQLLTVLNSELSKLAHDTGVVLDVDITNVEQAKKTLEAKKKRMQEMGGAPGIPTGLKVFDHFYPTGLAGGQLIVAIGWSGRGKSWFGSLLAAKAWEAGYRPMIVSLEMSPEEVRDRVYTILGNGTFKNSNFARGDINLDTFEDWGKKSLTKKNKFVVVSSQGMSRVTPSVVQTKIEQHKPDLVILDYQQLFDSDIKGLKETEKNKEVSRAFKRLAMANDIPVINLSQATQEKPSDTDVAPRIEQVAWSKSIQHDANLAIAVHLPPESNTMEIIARKNRHGSLFAFNLEWDIDSGIIKEVI